MATSGSFNTTGYEGRYLTLSWTATQSIANNTSTISWTLAGAGTASSSWYYAGNFKVVIAGETVYSSETRIQLYNGTTVATGTKTITHNNDGTKSVAMSAEAGIYTYAVNCTGSSTFTLTTIPRAASILTAPNFNDEENPTVTYSNPAGNNVSSLDICMSADNGATVLIGYKTLSATSSSYTFNLTSTERGYLRSACASSNSCTISFIIRTYIGGSYYYSKLNKTLSIINANPVISPTIQDSNDTTYGLTGNRNIMVNLYSNANITMGVTAQKNTTISSKKVTCGNKSRTSDGTINNVESGTFVITATDARGNTSTYTVNKTFIPYVKLTCDIANTQPDTQGNYAFTISGNYYNASFGSQSNTLTVQYRYKESGGSYGSWTSMTATKTNNTYTATANITGLDYRKNYIFQAKATDKLDSITTAEHPARALPVFDWSGSDFNFNVPVNFAQGATGITPSGGTKEYYATSSTGGSTTAKVLTCSDTFTYPPTTGTILRVKFSNGNTTASTPTLNVNNTGAITAVRYSNTTGSMDYMWQAGELVEFMYDGANWVMVEGGRASTTYYGQVKLSSSIGTSSTTALTPSAVNSFVQSGTWTPSVTGIKSSGSTVSGNYIKIGNVCNINFYFTGTANGGGTSSYIYIAGSSLPFTPATTQRWYAGGGALTNGYCKANYVFTGWCIDTNSSNNIYARTSQQATSANIRGSDYAYQGTNTTNTLYGSGTIQYITTS